MSTRSRYNSIQSEGGGDRKMKKITKLNAIKKLKSLARTQDDPERCHIEADEVLLSLINDRLITKHYGKIKKWYA